jgi:hypothetical protein
MKMAHLHSIYDTDNHFKIDPITRAIKNESNSKVKLMQFDHKSERFTFEIPRFIEGHDMSLSDKVLMHFDNIDSRTKEESNGRFTSIDVQLSPENEDMVIFSYLIENTATRFGGSLNFMIEFICYEENGVTIDYAWHTDTFQGISVGTGIHNTETSILINGLGSGARIGEVALIADNWTGEDNLYSQVVTIDGVTPNSQIDLTPSVEQLAVFYEKDLTFVTENENGVVTVYAIGEKPQNDYTIQVTITEVYYE